MSRLYKIFIKIFPIFMLIACVIGSFVFINLQNIKTREIPKAIQLQTKRDLNSGISAVDLDNGPVNQKSEKKSDSKSDKSEKDDENNKTNSSDNAKLTGTNQENTNLDVFDVKPNDNAVKTDKIYFNTSIKNGETVKSRHYSFIVTHLYDELEVKSIQIYVNDIEVIQFNGKVLLNEGKNTIRVFVKYIDESRKVISVFADYTVYCDLGSISIETDLSNKTVNEQNLIFFAKAVHFDKIISLTAECNGSILENKDGLFSAALQNGENVIVLTAIDEEVTETQRFIITYEEKQDLFIKTSLFDRTVNDDIFSFAACIQNGSENSKLAVSFNGRTINEKDEKYIVKLNIGVNILRLKANDYKNGKSFTKTEDYTIKFVPIADEKTAPEIKFINVSNGVSIKGNIFTLDMLAKDYKGNRIYHNGIHVLLNGQKYTYSWESGYTSYRLYLGNGKNTIDVRITDSDGRYSDYSYAINCEKVADGEPLGEITISVDANVLGLNYIIKPCKVTVYQGENGAEIVTRFLKEQGFDYNNSGNIDSGFYLSRIIKKNIALNAEIPDELLYYIKNDNLELKEQRYDDSLGEIDYCQGSGWMTTLNDYFVNFSLSDAVFKAGDVLKIRYTLAYGKDIGGFSSTGGEGNFDKLW